MPLLESASADLVWVCDGCQRRFVSWWDNEVEEDRDTPDLLTGEGQTFCEPCRLARFGPGPYEPE